MSTFNYFFFNPQNSYGFFGVQKTVSFQCSMQKHLNDITGTINDLITMRGQFDLLPCPVSKTEKFFNEALYRINQYLKPYDDLFGILLNGTRPQAIEQSKILDKVDKIFVEITLGTLYSLEISELLEFVNQNSNITELAVKALDEFPKIVSKTLVTLYAIFMDTEANTDGCELSNMAEDSKAMISTLKEFKVQLLHIKNLFKFALENNKRCDRTLIQSKEGGKHLYFFHHFEATWYGALQICLRLNMTLLAIDSADEQLVILDILNENSNFNSTKKYFVGATDEGGMDNEYFWISNGKTVDFELNFQAGEPNNQFSSTSVTNKEDCLVLMSNVITMKYEFSDTSCNEPRNFICQKLIK